jgi:3-oxoacyl-[acyl-carrier protein] reductase
MIEKKQALVTGASRGIGAAVAQALQDDGYFVIGTATSEQGAHAISTALGEAGRGMMLDVNDKNSIEKVFAELGSLQVLVNNAGITHDNLLLRMSEEQWEEVIDTNLRGVFRMCKSAAKMMVRAQTGGRIINIASVVGAMGNPGQCNYAAAKAGLFGFSKSLAKEVGAREITVNVVAPGFVKTDMTKDLNLDEFLTQIPIRRLGSVEDIAHAVRFLASPLAGYITGHILHINGGIYMA